MKMEDYLEATSDASRALFGAVNELKRKLPEFELSLIHLKNLQKYLSGFDPNGRGEWHLDFFRQEWEAEPTEENVSSNIEWTEDCLAAKRQSISVLSGSILILAQNGIKKVLGAPSVWNSHINTVRSPKGFCVLEAIWYGRNQSAHVEGLRPGNASHTYFQDLERRLGADFSLRNNAEFIPVHVVDDVLGWFDTGLQSRDEMGRTRFEQDMIAIGRLA